jgi:hypothetical protein
MNIESKEKQQERFLQLVNERKSLYQSLIDINKALDNEFINYIRAEYPDYIDKLENYLIKEGKIQPSSKINHISYLGLQGEQRTDFGKFLIIKTNNDEEIKIMIYASDYFLDFFSLENKDVNIIDLEDSDNESDVELSGMIGNIKDRIVVENEDYI